jgi:hypothetical protein
LDHGSPHRPRLGISITELGHAIDGGSDPPIA